MFGVVERVKPDRLVLDSLSEIRLLAQSSLRYRRQILMLKHYFARTRATVLMLDDLTTEALDKTVHSVAHGVVRLEDRLGIHRRVRRGPQEDRAGELTVVLGDHQPLAGSVTELLDGRRHVEQLLVSTSTKEGLPELGQLRNIGHGRVTQGHEGPGHPVLPMDRWPAEGRRGVIIR